MLKSLFAVLEGFVVLVATHWLSVGYFALTLLEVNSNLPWIVAAIISGALSPVVATLYMWFRLRFIPMIIVRAKILRRLAVGIPLAWLVVFTEVLLLGKGDPFTQEILKTQSQPLYFYLAVFLLVAWGPFFEETLNRGYFFETLRQSWGDALALLISSFLFVSFHGIFDVIYYGGSGYELLFIALYSIIFTVVYMHGGLIAAVVTHIFVNSYLLYLNINP